MQDLEERMKELEDSIASKDTIQKMLKGLFQNGLNASKKPNVTNGSEEPVKDLGVLGRKSRKSEKPLQDTGRHCQILRFPFFPTPVGTVYYI